jgi:hypothetical protein
MQLAKDAANGTYATVGLHLKHEDADHSAFYTQVEPGAFTEMIASACVIAQLGLLNLRYSALTGLRLACGCELGFRIAMGWVAGAPYGCGMIGVSRECEGTAAERPSLAGLKSEERPRPGRLRVTTTM